MLKGFHPIHSFLNQALDIYQAVVRPLLFSGLKADAEWLHQQSMLALNELPQRQNQLPVRWFCQRLQASCSATHPSLRRSLWGLDFDNPVGLAAGFDKDGIAAPIWSAFGFGFAEIGTVTLHAQPGNPKPRLFRLLSDRAALNRMGFNNQGAEAMAARLASYPPNPLPRIPLGINLGKSKITPLEDAAQDYLGSFRLLKDWGDYFAVNVSSPNTPGLRSLQSSDQLDLILAALQQENQGEKPLLVKIAPDLEWEAIADVITLAQTHNLAGIIATNTTIRRDNLKTQVLPETGNPIQDETGGISGAPVRQRSTEVIRFISQKTNGTLPIIGVGGIFTPEDAWEKITAGASLIQVYTGWIYEGPWMVRRILDGLAQTLEAKGFDHISQAVGTAAFAPNTQAAGQSG